MKDMSLFRITDQGSRAELDCSQQWIVRDPFGFAGAQIGFWGFRQLVRVKPKAEEEEDAATKRDRMQIGEIERILGQMHEKWEQDLVADVPRAVRENVRGLLSDWARYHHLALPDGAQTSLEAHVAQAGPGLCRGDWAGV